MVPVSIFLLPPCKQRRDLYAEGGGDLAEHDDAQVLVAVLDFGQVGTVDARLIGKLFLRQLFAVSQFPYVGADAGAYIHAPIVG